MADTTNYILDALLARKLRVHARDGDLDAFNRHVREMLTRGATRAEQLELLEVLNGTTPSSLSIVTLTHRRGRPSGAPGQVRTALGMLDRNIVGDAILQRIVGQQHRDRAAISSALGWAESHFRIRRVMARALLREALEMKARQLRGHARELSFRAGWLVLRLWLDSPEGRAAEPDADALIAFGDREFASIK